MRDSEVPLPFEIARTSPTFTHHVHELAGGGPNTPDSVIALCPKYHYRVHHGADCEVYNQEFIHRLTVIEDNLPK